MIIEDKQTFSLTHLDDIESVGLLEFPNLNSEEETVTYLVVILVRKPGPVVKRHVALIFHRRHGTLNTPTKIR